MNEAFRLSRLRAPRSTVTTVMLLAAFFIAFGLVMSAAADAPAASPRYFDSTTLTFVNWLFGSWKELVG